MPEQWMFSLTETLLFLLAAEGLFFCIVQLRTNHFLKEAVRRRTQKEETLKKMREEVRAGASDIPVVRFDDKKQPEKPQVKKEEAEKQPKGGYDAGEMAVLTEMMTEFFG